MGKESGQSQKEQTMPGKRYNSPVRGESNHTVTDKQRKANKENAQLSTGPKTEEGKAASSRNRWIHGRFSRAFQGEGHAKWGEMGLIMGKPCKKKCPMYPCSLVENDLTRAGGDCLDKTVYVEAFDAVICAMSDGNMNGIEGLMAKEIAQNIEILNMIRDSIHEHGVVVKFKLFNKKGKKIGVDIRPNPMLLQLQKLSDSIGINFAEAMASPRAVARMQEQEDVESVMGALMGNIARIGNKNDAVDAEFEAVDK